MLSNQPTQSMREMKLASDDWKQCIQDGSNLLGIQIAEREISQFAAHATELSIWNRKINLTGIKNPFEVAIKHYVDSIVPIRMIPEGASILDIGSGAGFPGIPIKVMRPSSSVTLIDASRKKVNFLKHVIRKLELQNIEALQSRAEEAAGAFQKILKGPYSGPSGFEVIISRALSSLGDFARMALPLLTQTGILIALKGKVAKSELESVRAIQMESDNRKKSIECQFSVQLKKYLLPYVNLERSIVCLRPTKGFIK
jgi:16S rRNA (guanine527-N7)-methyltransferase